MKPTNIKIIKWKGEDYFRLSYRIGSMRVTTAGFQTKEKLIKIIKKDTLFVIKQHRGKE